MKHIKSYEHITEDAQVCDYVIINININSETDQESKLAEFIKNNVGQVIKDEERSRLVKYTNKPDPIISKKYFNKENNYWRIWIGKANKTIGFGKTPEEAKMKANANKYNL